MIREYKILFLLIPLVSRLVLPSSIEILMLIVFLDAIPLYIPDILILFYLIFGQRTELNKNFKLKIAISFFFLIVFLGSFNQEYDNFILSFFFGNFLFLCLFISTFYKLSLREKKISLYVFVVVYFYLTIQIILYSTSTLFFSAFDLRTTFSGITRIDTTVGAATGSSAILFLLMLIICPQITNKKFSYLLYLLGYIAILFLMSRSAIICSTCFLGYLILKNNRNFFKVSINYFLILMSLFYFGLFSPILDRLEVSSTEYRVSKLQNGLDLYESNKLFGVGMANTFQSKLLRHTNLTQPTHPLASHNSYLQIILETGAFGFLSFLIVLYLFFNIKYYKNIIGTGIIFYMLSIGITESVIITDLEYTLALSFALLTSYNDLDEKF